MRISDLFLTNRLRAWRDQELYAAAQILRQLAADLADEANSLIAALPTRELMTGQGAFLAQTLAPMIRLVSEPVMANVVDAANARLRELAASNAVWAAGPTDGATDQSLDGWQDVVLAAGPLAGGVVAAASIPAIAITTTTSLFGLMTTTAISWPVALSGGAVAAAMIATGIWNTGQMTDRLRHRLRRKAKEQILSTLLAGRNSKSLLEQYADMLEETVQHARKG